MSFGKEEKHTMFQMQWKVMLHKKSFWLAFLISLGYAIWAFVYEYQMTSWREVSGFWHYCGMGDLSQWNYFSVILCFLVALPAMSFQDDVSDRTLASIGMRGSRAAYLKAKMLVVFCAEFVITVLPLLLNLILCLVAFPHIYTYAPSPYGGVENTETAIATDSTWTKGVTVPFVGLFRTCPVLYIVLFLMMLGCFVGLLGMFLLALSFWVRRIKILLFLPVFGMTKLGNMLDILSYEKYYADHTQRYVNYNLWDYVSPMSFDGKVYPGFFLGILLLCGFIYLSYCMMRRKEFTD
jgi:hypothetical protein